jgi:hypothetical protein
MRYIILCGLVIAATICSVATGNSGIKAFINGLSTNLISEFLGAALIAIFLENYIRSKENNLKIRAKQLAFDKLAIPLNRIFEELLRVIDIQFPGVINFEVQSVGELFNDKYFNALKNANMKMMSHRVPPINWAGHFGEVFSGLQISFEKTIDLYGRYFEIEDLEKIEKVYSHHILGPLSGMNSIVNTPAPMDMAYFFSIKNILPGVQTFIFTCIEVSDLCNANRKSLKLSPVLLKSRVRPTLEEIQRKFGTENAV